MGKEWCGVERALEIVKEIQQDDHCKTDTIEDSNVNAVIIYWLLLEKKDRPYP